MTAKHHTLSTFVCALREGGACKFHASTLETLAVSIALLLAHDKADGKQQLAASRLARTETITVSAP